MPITENLEIKYSIPDEWLKSIDLEFLKTFRNELYKVKYLTLGECYNDTLAYCESTAGWNVAFKLACIKTNKQELYKYASSLPWYDSDLFDSELGDLLVKNKLVMGGFFEDIISKELNVDSKEITQCMKCGKFFLKEDMVIDIEYPETDNDAGMYYCIHCNGFDHMQYYREGLEK